MHERGGAQVFSTAHACMHEGPRANYRGPEPEHIAGLRRQHGPSYPYAIWSTNRATVLEEVDASGSINTKRSPDQA